jgi:Tol biopolymer transport system component
MNVDGSDLKKLSDHFDYVYSPVFSPDGSKIAFQSRLFFRYDIWIMNTDGSGLKNLSNHPENGSVFDEQPSFSPDGSRIAFASRRDGNDTEIYVVNVDGSGLKKLSKDEGGDPRVIFSDLSPVFSPDGNKIAFISNRHNFSSYGLYVMSVDGSSWKNLSQPATTYIHTALLWGRSTASF